MKNHKRTTILSSMRYCIFVTALLAWQQPVQAWIANSDSSITRRLPTTPTQLFASSPPGGGRKSDDNGSDSNDHSHHSLPIHNKNLRKRVSGSNEWGSSKQQRQNMTAYYEKQIQVLKARSKIDRILKGPNPPLDMEAELQKVASIAPPSPHLNLQNPADLKQEEHIMQLEADIRQAVKQQDYDWAAQAHHEIGQMHVDDCGAVLQVNAQYYLAFSQKDFQKMTSIWWNDNTATCIHPSQKPLVGSKAVLNSWQKMFDSHAGAFQKSILEPHNIRISVKGATTAVVTCDEHVYARRFVRGQQRETVLVNKLTATNIFRKCGSKWYITHHHASWHADSQAAKNALNIRGKGGGVQTMGRNMNNYRSTSFISEDEEDGRTEYVDDWNSELDGSHRNDRIRSDNEQTGDDDDDDDSSMDGILGISNYGPLLGDDSKKEEPTKKVKGLIMGSLNDVLGNSLGDILGGSPQKSGDVNRPNKPIIRIARINGKSVGRSDMVDSLNLDEDLLDAYDEEDQENESEEKEAHSRDGIRKECILALRKLSTMGVISPRQKRLLLTDIISHSNKGEVSMVETAFELLCCNDSGEDAEDVAHEEFADQCRQFADQCRP